MKVFILIIIVFFSIGAVAGDYGKGEQRPLLYERLNKPIPLSGACREIKIIEWRATEKFSNSTELNNKSISIVNAACNLAVNNFYKFILSKKNYIIHKDQTFDTSLSFMPADLRRGGTNPRNLNDLNYRFAYRSEQSALWGWFQRGEDWAYIRNDVLEDDGKTINKMFIVVTVHELFHAMSYATGIYNQHKPESKKDLIEEELAQEFTEYLGLGR